MNCTEFRFPQVHITLEFSASGRTYIGEDYYYQWSAAGTFSYTNTFQAGRKLKYGIANLCDWYRPEYADNPFYRSCIRKDHLCGRFSLLAINPGTFDTQYLYCGDGTVAGNSTLNSDPPDSLNYSLYLNGNERTGNAWNISNLQPWDNADPFYYRNLQMYEATSEELKAVTINISGYSDSIPRQGFPGQLSFRFARNLDKETASIIPPLGNNTATGTATLGITVNNVL
jgi:hypothetical protein